MRADPIRLAAALAMISIVACADAEGGRVPGQAGQGSESAGDGSGSGSPGSSTAALGRAPRPIVLLHGAAGFDQIGPLDYYFDVADTLTAAGHDVFTTVVDPLQTVEVRAERLAEQIDDILAETGADRVHLIGHSMGGLDARFLVSSLGYGDRVATLTTISTPHLGSRVADVALELLPGGAEDALAFLIDFLVGGALGSDQDIAGQIYQLTEEYSATFNEANPDDPQVEYYSVAGVTQTNPFTNPFRNDLCDPLLLAGFAILRPHGASDALVSVDSASHGTLLGTIPADHLDEVGQFLGTTSLGFQHRSFYRDLAEFLTDPDAPPPL
jgi:triacylglycerol esterase/lipase EstA (alpha/beta hydrolase family)